MPRGGARPGAGRKPKNPGAAVKKKIAEPKAERGFSESGTKAEEAPEAWPFGAAEAPPPPAVEDLSELTPLDFLLSVMRDAGTDQRVRIQAASLAAPFCHTKKGEGGKKDERANAAKAAGKGKFAASAPPRLAVNNTR